MTARLLEWLRVSERPESPPGAGEVRMFRASRRYLRYVFAVWGLQQAGALAGLLLSLAIFAGWRPGGFEFMGIPEALEDVTVSLGPLRLELMPWLHRIEVFALSTFALQLLVSGWWLHLRWRLHWYLVGEEMLRIREGLWLVREQTFTLSKIQNMTVHQNLIQRWLGIGDLEIHTAGGAGKAKGDDENEAQLHVGWFRGLDDPWALRDELRRRLGRYAGAGLGDHDDDPIEREDGRGGVAPIALGPSAGEASALASTLDELRREARALRSAAEHLESEVAES